MKRIMLAVAVLAAFAAGQWSVRSVMLPDSLSGSEARFIAHDTRQGRIFIGGTAIVVIDGATQQRVARLAIGGTRMLYVQSVNKVYMPEGWGLKVIDAAAMRVVDSLDTCLALDWSLDPITNRLYCVGRGVTAVDCATDSIVAHVNLPDVSYRICCAPPEGKAYCDMGDPDGLAVVDCFGDSLLSVIPLVDGGVSMVYNERNSRLYAIGAGHGGVVDVIDCRTDSMIGSLPVGTTPSGMCLNTRDNKLYVSDCVGCSLAIIDCGRDSLVSRLHLGLQPIGLVYDSVDNVVYVALAQDSIVMVDGAGDTVMGRFCLPHAAPLLLHDAGLNLVYAADGRGNLSAFRGGSNQPVAQHVLWVQIRQMVGRRGAREIYLAEDGDWVSVIDAESYGYLRRFRLGVMVGAVAFDSTRDKLYLAGSGGDNSSVSVVHCSRRDSVGLVRGTPWAAIRLMLDEERGRAWCGGSGLFTFDLAADTVLGICFSGRAANGLALAHDLGRVFASCGGIGVLAYDAETATVLDTLVGAIGGELMYVPRRRLLCSRSSQFAVFDAVTSQQRRLLGGRFNAWALSHDQSRLYLARANSIDVFDFDSMDLTDNLPVSGCSWMATDTTRGWLYCGGWPLGISVVDMNGDTVIGHLPLEVLGGRAYWDERGRQLFVTENGRSAVTVIRDTTPVGIAERSLMPNASRITPEPTIVRGVLMSLQPTADGSRQELLDVTGRKVMDLKAGENDVSRLAPGVYFVRKWGQGTRGEGLGDKVVITR